MNAPVSTVLHEGKQYVVAYSAGNALVGSARGDSVWLFGLEGTLSPVTPGTPAPRTVPAPAGATPENSAAAAAADPEAFVASADLANGQQVYARTCVLCHGEDGKGGHGTGAPLDTVTDLAATIEAIQTGRNTMPSFSAVLTADEIRDVSAYVWERL
jgi:mono/diheme cytochrome c family protein